MIAVVAMNAAGCIGRDGTLPWRHPEDLAFFKKTTVGGTVVMGRKTWDSLPKRPLPGRRNVVLTRDPERVHDREWAAVTDLAGLDSVLEDAPGSVYIIGGAEIYAALWERIEGLLVTRVDDVVTDCDTFFPHPLDARFSLTDTIELSAHCRVECWTAG